MSISMDFLTKSILWADTGGAGLSTIPNVCGAVISGALSALKPTTNVPLASPSFPLTGILYFMTSPLSKASD
jgi:hypothetical protein